MEKELLRLLLEYKFYENNKGFISKNYLPSNLHQLYELICKTHETHKKDLTIAEVKELYKVEYPVTTKAQWDNLCIILNEIPNEISNEIASTILKKAHVIEAGRRLAALGIEIINGREAEVAKAREIIQAIESGRISEYQALEPISDELDDILESVETTTKWHFNLRQLKEVASGVGPGIFSIITARTELGKTSTHTSLCAAPGGFAEQGALVHVFINEEPAQRVQIRAVSAYTGMPFLEILNRKEEARALYGKIRGNIKYFDAKGMNIKELHAHCKHQKPDVVVLDQLDKFSIDGSFARRDEQLGALYARSRDIAGDCNHGSIAITQASAAVEGKTYISSADLAESRTAKAAEADLLVGIGKMPGHEEKSRVLNIIKNKITGDHRDIVCILHSEISRLVD